MQGFFILLAIFVIASTLFAQGNLFTGTFANEQIILTLQESSGQITGQVQLQGQSFPVTARFSGSNAIQGSYQYFGQNFPFEATVQGDVMTLTSEGAVYTLHKKQSATGSLAKGTPPSPAAPQNPNEIVDKEFGVRFTPPKGWIAQKNEAGYLLGAQKTEIHLCPQGYFKYYDSNQMSIDGGYSTGYNASAFGSGKDQGQGTWEVAARAGAPLLVLKFHDGRVNEYKIAYENKKLFLNGNRYFWTTVNSEIADQRPECW